MRKPVNLVRGHTVDSRQDEEDRMTLRRKPIVEEIVIEGGLLMMNALMMDGGLLGESVYEIEATCTAQGKAMAIVSVPKLGVEIGVLVFDELLLKAFPSLHLHEMCKRCDLNVARGYSKARQVA